MPHIILVMKLQITAPNKHVMSHNNYNASKFSGSTFFKIQTSLKTLIQNTKTLIMVSSSKAWFECVKN